MCCFNTLVQVGLAQGVSEMPFVLAHTEESVERLSDFDLSGVLVPSMIECVRKGHTHMGRQTDRHSYMHTSVRTIVL